MPGVAPGANNAERPSLAGDARGVGVGASVDAGFETKDAFKTKEKASADGGVDARFVGA